MCQTPRVCVKTEDYVSYRANLESVENELCETQERASSMIKQRETEILGCSQAISTLSDEMTSMLKTLSKRAGLQVGYCSDYNVPEILRIIVHVLHVADNSAFTLCAYYYHTS